MSINASVMDQRSRRTRAKLAHALIDLGARQPIDSITVAQLARAAGIGRSTFYAQFGSFRDYLTRSYAAMLERAALAGAEMPDGVDHPLAVRAILDHVWQAKPFALAMQESAHSPAVMGAAEARLRRIILANLSRIDPVKGEADDQATASFIAGGFMGMLRQWIETEMREPVPSLQARFEARCRALMAGLRPFEPVSPSS
jgi:AcrR family transcriptional regulator